MALDSAHVIDARCLTSEQGPNSDEYTCPACKGRRLHYLFGHYALPLKPLSLKPLSLVTSLKHCSCMHAPAAAFLTRQPALSNEQMPCADRHEGALAFV